MCFDFSFCSISGTNEEIDDGGTKMFGFGKKTQDVRLTEKEIRELRNNMS